MNYLLDTGIIIGLLRETPIIVEKYRMLPQGRSTALTVYSLTELFEGINKIANSDKRDAQSKILKILIGQFEKKKLIFALTRLQAEDYSKLKIALERNGTPIPVMDLLIGTIAIDKNSILITTDQTHFKTLKKIAPQLKVEFW